jgi:hypothetical protein
MLEALVKARHQRLTAGQIREILRVNDENVSNPEQVVKDTASSLRCHLRNALKSLNMQCENPLPSVGKGRELTYKLEMPKNLP